MPGVTLQVIATLADALEISVDHLLGRKNSDAVELEPAGVAIGTGFSDSKPGRGALARPQTRLLLTVHVTSSDR